MEWLTGLIWPIITLIVGSYVGHKIGYQKAHAWTAKAHGVLTYALQALTKADQLVVEIHEAVEDENLSTDEVKAVAKGARAVVDTFRQTDLISKTVKELDQL